MSEPTPVLVVDPQNEPAKTLAEEFAAAKRKTLVVVDAKSEQSATLGQLATALAKAQGAMRHAVKDSVGQVGHQKVKYADLASVWDAIREPLSSNGLAVLQRVANEPEGVIITTMLVHSSGEWVRDRLVLPIAQRTPQGVGSVITYGRRYALSALVGVAPEDDDGAAAEGAQRPQEKPRQTEPPERDPVEVQKERAALEAAKLRTRRVSKLWKKANAPAPDGKGMGADAFKTWALSVLGLEKSSAEWTEEELSKLEAAL